MDDDARALAVLKAALVDPFDFGVSCLALVSALKILCGVSGVSDEVAIERFADVFPRIVVEVDRREVDRWLEEQRRRH